MDYSLCLELGALFLNANWNYCYFETTLRLKEDFDSWTFSSRKFDSSAMSRKFPRSFRNDSRCLAQLRSWRWGRGLVADITQQSFHSWLHQNSWCISSVAFGAALTAAWRLTRSLCTKMRGFFVFFAGISSLGRLLHLHRNDSVPAQGELPLPGLSQPGLQQKGGRPTEWNVPLWEMRQRVSQLQVPPYPLCKWLFSVFLIPYSPTNTPAQICKYSWS